MLLDCLAQKRALANLAAGKLQSDALVERVGNLERKCFHFGCDGVVLRFCQLSTTFQNQLIREHTIPATVHLRRGKYQGRRERIRFHSRYRNWA